MSILWTIIIGLIVGALAKLVMPGKDPGGMIITILLGVVGAFVGTLVHRARAGAVRPRPGGRMDHVRHWRGHRPGYLSGGHRPARPRRLIRDGSKGSESVESRSIDSGRSDRPA